MQINVEAGLSVANQWHPDTVGRRVKARTSGTHSLVFSTLCGPPSPAGTLLPNGRLVVGARGNVWGVAARVGCAAEYNGRHPGTT